MLVNKSLSLCGLLCVISMSSVVNVLLFLVFSLLSCIVILYINIFILNRKRQHAWWMLSFPIENKDVYIKNNYHFPSLYRLFMTNVELQSVHSSSLRTQYYSISDNDMGHIQPVTASQRTHSAILGEWFTVRLILSVKGSGRNDERGWINAFRFHRHSS